jgi:acyl dehydratase
MLDSEIAPVARRGARTMKYWEDLVSSPVRRYGPLTFSSQLLDQLLDLMGEKHPIHASDSFAQSTERKQRIVPGGFIHSITSGWVVQHGSPVAIIGLRSMSYDFLRPLYPDVPFYFTTETSSSEAIDARCGVLNTVRRVCDEKGQAYAIGRMSAVVRRRPQQSQQQ